MAKNPKKLKKEIKNLLYFVSLISNKLSQLEPSSLPPLSVLHHRHLLQTTCYNHLLLLLLLLISREENRRRNRLRTPLVFFFFFSLKGWTIKHLLDSAICRIFRFIQSRQEYPTRPTGLVGYFLSRLNKS